MAKRPDLAVTRRDGLLGDCVLRFVDVPASQWCPACSVCNLWSEKHQQFATEIAEGPSSPENPDGLYAARCEVEDDVAAALILDRWLEALPVHHGLMRAIDTHGPRWYVDGRYVWPCADTRIEALAAFYLEPEKETSP